MYWSSYFMSYVWILCHHSWIVGMLGHHPLKNTDGMWENIWPVCALLTALYNPWCPAHHGLYNSVQGTLLSTEKGSLKHLLDLKLSVAPCSQRPCQASCTATWLLAITLLIVLATYLTCPTSTKMFDCLKRASADLRVLANVSQLKSYKYNNVEQGDSIWQAAYWRSTKVLKVWSFWLWPRNLTSDSA